MINLRIVEIIFNCSLSLETTEPPFTIQMRFKLKTIYNACLFVLAKVLIKANFFSELQSYLLLMVLDFIGSTNRSASKNILQHHKNILLRFPEIRSLTRSTLCLFDPKLFPSNFNTHIISPQTVSNNGAGGG